MNPPRVLNIEESFCSSSLSAKSYDCEFRDMATYNHNSRELNMTLMIK